MKQSAKQALSVLIIALGMLTFATPAYAQEGSNPNQAPTGVGILILLMGLAAIGFIGFAYLAQSRASREDDGESDEE
jgi:hypothetical protein